MNETSIHSLLKANWPDVMLERVESSVNTGTADCNACHDGFEFWLEYKVVGHKAKTTIVPVKCSLGVIWLRPAQFAWHAKRALHRSKIFVIARTEDAIVLMRITGDMQWQEVFVTKKPFDYKGLLWAIRHAG